MPYPHRATIESAQATIELKCFNCKKPQQLTVPAANYLDWRNGSYIQNALPMLNADQRELLISGTCDQCWKEMFGEEWHFSSQLL